MDVTNLYIEGLYIEGAACLAFGAVVVVFFHAVFRQKFAVLSVDDSIPQERKGGLSVVFALAAGLLCAGFLFELLGGADAATAADSIGAAGSTGAAAIGGVAGSTGAAIIDGATAGVGTAAVADAAAAAGAAQGRTFADTLLLVGAIVVMCLGTGFAEEAIFRGALFMAPLQKWPNFLRWAALSSLAFALCHVEWAAFGLGVWAAFATILKGVQSFFFGFAMCACVVRARNLWFAGLLHGAFDLLAIGPAVFVLGHSVETYAYTGVGYLVCSLVATIALAGIAVWALLVLSRASFEQKGEEGGKPLAG